MVEKVPFTIEDKLLPFNFLQLAEIFLFVIVMFCLVPFPICIETKKGLGKNNGKS